MNATVQAPAEIDPKQSKADPLSQANLGPQGTASTPSSGDARSGPPINYLLLRRRWFGRFRRVSDPDAAICDRRFIHEIRKLQLMRSIQRNEGVEQPQEIISDLWSLLQLRYAPSGRSPTKDEWTNADKLFVALFGKQNKDSNEDKNKRMRKKFVSSQVPMLIGYVPLFAAVLAAGALCSAVYAAAHTSSETFDVLVRILHEVTHKVLGYFHADFHLPISSGGNDSDRFVVCYLLWSISMGVIGACAWVGMNAISELDDAKFDISSRHENLLRLVLGGVFALVLALPFGLQDFTLFCYYAGHLLSENATPTFLPLANAAALVLPMPDAASTNASAEYAVSTTSLLTYAFALIVPFLLGYSTSLVTTVLTKNIKRAQDWFNPDSNDQSKNVKDQSDEKNRPGQPGTDPAPAAQ
jgi:hypothetical protein